MDSSACGEFSMMWAVIIIGEPITVTSSRFQIFSTKYKFYSKVIELLEKVLYF